MHTEGGFVEGFNKKLSLFGGDSVDIFKGIPFAAAPKALENPQQHPGWQGGRRGCGGPCSPGGGPGRPPSSHQPRRPPTGTLEAKDFKKRCLQATITQDDTFGEEDCLYLNIWVPQGGSEGQLPPPPCPPPPPLPREAPQAARGPGPAPWSGLGASELNFPDICTEWRGGTGGGASGVTEPAPPASVSYDLPVMIWIYGGAFLMGSSQGANFLSNYLYDGEEIATRGNVIVVTFNYRVGPLGFLSTGDSSLPGPPGTVGSRRGWGGGRSQRTRPVS